MRIAFYISGHGFGHAARDIELMNAVAARAPEVEFAVRTSVAPWLFDRMTARVEILPGDTDTGLTPIDSLRFDERATVARAAAFYRDFSRRVDEEAALLRRLGVTLVIADIPPLGCAAGSLAQLPTIALGNFTWDWIYERYPAFASDAPHVLPTIRRAYAAVTRAIRLPFHGGFDPMIDRTEDVPLVARRSHRSPAETRQRLGVSPGRRLVLTSFSSYGAALPLRPSPDAGDIDVLNVDGHPPHGLRYQDLVAAADVVLSKPGYGIVSECVANETALLYTSRGVFPEYDVFVREMPEVLRCRFLPQVDLEAGRWAADLDLLLAQPAPPLRPRIDGAAVAADRILALASATSKSDHL